MAATKCLRFLSAAAALCAAAALLLVFVSTQPASAQSSGGLSGYAWANNDQGAGNSIGWISFSCANENVCNNSNYAISVSSNGAMSGYAWNDQAGWISFNAADVGGCPSGSCAPTVNQVSGAITGWARILAEASTGGWIHLSNQPTYGVTTGGPSCVYSGYSYNDDEMGWIHWSGSGYGVAGSGTACGTPPSVSIAPNNPQVPVGAAVSITWSSVNATSCSSAQFSTGNATSNSSGVPVTPPSGTSSYPVSITCQNAAGSVSAQTIVTILNPIVTLSGPALVGTKDNVPLTWTVQNASACVLTGPGINQSEAPANGGATFSPISQTSAYTMTCNSGSGSSAITATSTVMVHLAPIEHEQ